nr:hypothetical protein [Marinobacter fuscus]
MLLIMMPVLYPSLAPLGIDPIWFGIIGHLRDHDRVRADNATGRAKPVRDTGRGWREGNGRSTRCMALHHYDVYLPAAGVLLPDCGVVFAVLFVGFGGWPGSHPANVPNV